jgi:hypothetical protein
VTVVGHAVIEGTWEEVAARAGEFAGRRVRLYVMDEPPANGEPEEYEFERLSGRAAFEAYRKSLKPGDLEPVEDFEQFRREHPFRFRQLEDFE